MALSTSAARIYLLGSVLVLPAPFLMPLNELFPPAPDQMIVWPVVALGSAPLAVVGLLLAALHHRHSVSSSSARVAAGSWGLAGFLTFWPVMLWLPPGKSYYIAGGITALASVGASIAFIWLARDMWRLRLPGKWWVLIACLQVGLLFGTIAFNWAKTFGANSGGLEEFTEQLVMFALDCALLSAVLLVAHAVAWWRRLAVERR
jgi:hypothetical protein